MWQRTLTSHSHGAIHMQFVAECKEVACVGVRFQQLTRATSLQSATKCIKGISSAGNIDTIPVRVFAVYSHRLAQPELISRCDNQSHKIMSLCASRVLHLTSAMHRGCCVSQMCSSAAIISKPPCAKSFGHILPSMLRSSFRT